MFGRLRDYLARMFGPDLYTPEGFRLTERQFVAPQDTGVLSAAQKRAITICNLFANHHKTIDEISQLLDTDRRAVILALIQEVLILDRRRSHQRYQPRTNRRH
jgi:hypothetical protein